jgi:hypothetical protein
VKRRTFPSDRRPRSRREIGSIQIEPALHAELTRRAVAAGVCRRAFCDDAITAVLDQLGAPAAPEAVVSISARIAGAIWKRAKRSGRPRAAVFEDAIVQALAAEGAP